MDLPNIDLSGLPLKTIVKTVMLDMRGEKLIDEALETQRMLFHAMEQSFK